MFNYDTAFGSYIGPDWEKISADPVTYKHPTGAVLVVRAGPHTHRTGHPWTLTLPTSDPIDGTGARKLQGVLAAHGIGQNPRRMAA